MELIASFARKGEEFAHVLKMGRTQLQDAVPMTLGQTFHGFASVLQGEVENLDHAASEFLSINMGATAIGTGICAEPGYAERCTAAIREITGWDVTQAEDLVGATSDTVCMVGYSSAMKRIASKMNKICNDLRLLSSGPRCGLGEFNLPARQPGSSIMPGKVNPVIPEVMNQIAFKVIGNELCVTMADEAAQMELNAMEPVMAQCCFESAELLVNGFDTLRIRCVEGITANEEKCLQYVHNSIGVVTALNPIIGYKNSTKIAREALETGRGVYELVLEHGILSREELDEVLKPENMIRPVKLDISGRGVRKFFCIFAETTPIAMRYFLELQVQRSRLLRLAAPARHAVGAADARAGARYPVARENRGDGGGPYRYGCQRFLLRGAFRL